MWTDLVDGIFVVNLIDRPDRLEETHKEFLRHEIPWGIWSATKDEDGRKGLRDTMRLLFEHCLEMEYDMVCVFEDDIKILPNSFNELMNDAVSQLPNDFDLLYMGGNLAKTPKRYSANLLQCEGIYSSHAVIYSKAAIKIILWLLNMRHLSDGKAYDVILVELVQRRGRSFCTYPLLVTQRSGYSDIAKKNVNYEVFIDKRYAQKTSGL